jgi:D-alanine-D-alanine ligase
MYGTVVGVLRGGPSSEHDVSLLSGHAVVANLPRDRYTVRDIYIDKKGEWYERGKVHMPSDILRTIDVVVSTLHGEYGESGELQRLFEQLGIPYVGANSLHSYMSLHKVLAKEKAKEVGIKTPKYYLVQVSADIDAITYEIVRTLAQPVVIKPVTGGSSIGVEIVGGYAQVHAALSKLLAEQKEALVEELIRGVEATVGVVEGLRGEDMYVLPPVEIIPHGSAHFSYDSKYSGMSQEIIPGRFSKEVQKELMAAAKSMHQALGQKHYSRSDFIVSKSGVHFLELNSAVATGLTKESLLPKSLASVGVTFPEFLSHVVDRAMLQSRPLF